MLRHFGASIYLSLVVVAGVPAVFSLLRPGPRKHVPTTYFSLASVAAVMLAFIPGNPQFLLARDALITAGTGIRFISTTRRSCPLVHTLTKPLIEGRFHWPGQWMGTLGERAQIPAHVAHLHDHVGVRIPR